MKKVTYVIKDAQGIHARPAGLLVAEAKKFPCAIKIAKGEKTADLKKILAVMGLCAKHGDSVTITFDGDKEEEAAKAIETFLKNNL